MSDESFVQRVAFILDLQDWSYKFGLLFNMYAIILGNKFTLSDVFSSLHVLFF